MLEPQENSQPQPDEVSLFEEPEQKGTEIKGIKNETGDNNCFLNSIIQTIWHIDSFRAKILELKHDTHDESCVMCALTRIFKSYQEEEDLSSYDLREALCGEGNKFKPGEFEDAHEAYDELLNSIHICSSSSSPETCDCAVHSTFNMKIRESYNCKCGEKVNTLEFDEWIHYISVDQVLDVNKTSGMKGLSNILRLVSRKSERECPSCTAECPLQVCLLNSPQILTLGLSWSTPTPPKNVLRSFLVNIESHINSKDFFDESKSSDTYAIKGVMCYSSLHYLVFVKVGKNWIKFDDSYCKLVGASWTSVFNSILENGLQPHTLWLEKTSM